VRRIVTLSVVLAALSFLASCNDRKPGVSATAPDASWHSLQGETLLAKANCLACHAASDAARERIRSVAAPKLLDSIGSRMTPEAMRVFLANPYAVKADSRMPDVLHGIPSAEKTEVIEDLVHFLASQRDLSAPSAAYVDVLPEDIKRGETLFRTIGCAVCHTSDDRARLAASTWHTSLAAFLRDPLASYPGGLMPDFHLREEDSSAIAAYLLQSQATDANGAATPSRVPGLHVEYFERPMSGDGIPEGDHDATRVFVAPTITIDVPRRNDDFALHFTGEIEIPTTGAYTFYLGSDDGSALSIDGKVVIDNGGPHGFFFKETTLNLDAGWHGFKLRYWEISVDNELRLEWKGLSIERGPVPAEQSGHAAVRLTPRTSTFTTDRARVERGAERFRSLGCANCHATASPGAKPLGQLASTGGCLGATPATASPGYQFTESERAALGDVVIHAASLDHALAPPLFVAHTMTRLGCVECHPRGDQGPPNERLTVFTADGSAELGDQGRLPPRLDGVGDKLLPDALEAQLLNGTKVRPYMRTRMPSFGVDATRGLAAALVAADRNPKHDVAVAFTAESAATGRILAGSGGATCTTCHTVNGRASLGVPAIDLGTMHERLRPGWFLAFVENPSSFSPGTRMTRFWMPNERIFPEYFQGDPYKQREALWNYLSLRDAMPPPAGLLSTQGQYELVPGAEPIVFGTFMRGVSPRTICVGYADLVHVAFDAEHGRLAKAWRGPFMDAKGTWDGRAGQLEQPLAKDSVDLAPGDAFVVLASRDAPWPEPSGHYRGMIRDAQRRPAFVVDLGEAVVRERPTPVLKAGGAWLRRTVEASAAEDRTDVYMRAAVGRSIKPVPGGFLVDGSVHVVTDAAGAFVRSAGDLNELLVPIDFKYVEGSDPRYRAVFAVDMDW